MFTMAATAWLLRTSTWRLPFNASATSLDTPLLFASVTDQVSGVYVHPDGSSLSWPEVHTDNGRLFGHRRLTASSCRSFGSGETILGRHGGR
jgi:hypothetical protein